MGFPILSLIIFLPLVGMLRILTLKKDNDQAIKWVAIVSSLIPLVLSIILWFKFDKNNLDMQFVEQHQWIPALGVNYYLGVDGLSLPLLFLTTLLTFLSMVYSQIINIRPKEYFALFLLLETGMLGVFLALDFFLFYVFWEVSLVPMYFLIGIWGGSRREYAAIKFFLYTLVGSVAMLLSILALYFESSPHTFDMMKLIETQPLAGYSIKASLVFLGFFLAFAIKVPMFPFHTWLPDAHVEAPTAGSVILAGVLLKMGTYGFVRVLLPLLPDTARVWAGWLAVLALVSIIYGAYVAMAQTDLKKLVAYSSVNHMGYVMLGVAAVMASSSASPANKSAALNGAILQMFTHGVITGALFFLVGIIYERTHTRDLSQYGGLGAKVPVFVGIFSIASFASLGLPGLAGFVSEFMVFLGSFSIYKLWTCLALLGVVITAAFFLWTIQRVALGPLNPKYNNLSDMDFREIFTLAPLVLLMFWVGLYPMPFLEVINLVSKNLFNGN